MSQRDRVWEKRIQLVPELALLEADAARQRAWDDLFKPLLRSPKAWLILALAVAVVTGSIPMFVQLGRFVRVPALTIVLLCGALGGVGAVAIAGNLLLREMRANLRRRLHAQGVELCLNCGYGVRGAARCSECGEAVSPRSKVDS